MKEIIFTVKEVMIYRKTFKATDEQIAEIREDPYQAESYHWEFVGQHGEYDKEKDLSQSYDEVSDIEIEGDLLL